MKKTIAIYITMIICLFLAKSVFAEDQLIFDSTDHYLGACQMTNKAEWELKEPINVTTFQVWYRWNTGETTIPVTITKDGEEFAQITAERTSCDPYQTMWCNADYKINKLFEEGTYSAVIPSSRMCLKPGSTGTIRLYNDSSAVNKEGPSPSPSPTPTLVITLAAEKNAIPPTITTAPVPQPCACNQTTILVTAAAASIVTSLIIGLILRR